MIACEVSFVVGLNGPTLLTTTLDLNSARVGGECGTYGSLHMLQMGRHFDHYYDRTVSIPVWNTESIYSAPAYGRRTKSQSSEVKGQIGESIGALVMRNKVGLATADIEPLLVDRRRKTPDFRVNWSTAAALLARSKTIQRRFRSGLPTEWPLECKSRPALVHSTKDGFFAGLPQLAAYWLLRGPSARSSIGFGLVCVAYNQMENATMHIVLPQNKKALSDAIDDLHAAEFTTDAMTTFLAKFRGFDSFASDVLFNCEVIE